MKKSKLTALAMIPLMLSGCGNVEDLLPSESAGVMATSVQTATVKPDTPVTTTQSTTVEKAAETTKAVTTAAINGVTPITTTQASTITTTQALTITTTQASTITTTQASTSTTTKQAATPTPVVAQAPADNSSEKPVISQDYIGVWYTTEERYDGLEIVSIGDEIAIRVGFFRRFTSDGTAHYENGKFVFTADLGFSGTIEFHEGGILFTIAEEHGELLHEEDVGQIWDFVCKVPGYPFG